jgi:hypothetical protein
MPRRTVSCLAIFRDSSPEGTAAINAGVHLRSMNASAGDRPRLTFYRIVRSNPTTVDDFMSHHELGIPSLDDDPVHHRMREGISVHATEAQSRAKARSRPWFGRFIARLSLPDDGSIEWARTAGGRGHHTLWGDPEHIRAYVVEVIPV